METEVKPDAILAAGGSDNRIPFSAKARTDGDGRYLITGLAEGHYVVSAVLKAFIVADSSADPGLSRTVPLDEGEAREKFDFTLIRGGVMTGKVIDDEGAPLIAEHVRLYTVDVQGQKRDFQGPSTYEMTETDDRGVYRIYGLPPGRYIISAGGEGRGNPFRGGSGKFARTYHPDATEEKQARIIEIKEGSEVADVDIRFGNARKTYEAEGRVADKETGKPVPRIYISCRSKPEKDAPNSGFSTTTIADGQGNFRIPGLIAGRYQVMIMDIRGETGYTGEVAEFEITNDNVSGVELKAFLGVSVSGVVVIEGGEATSRNQLQSMSVSARVSQSSAAMERYPMPQYFSPAKVNADGSFTISGLPAGGVSFLLTGFGRVAPSKRIERNGVEIKDAIEVRPGEKIAGVRIVVYQAQGQIRGQVQVVGGALPDGRRLHAYAARSAPDDEPREPQRVPVAISGISGSALVDEKGRFVIEGLPAGDYNLSITLPKETADGSWEGVSSPGSNQRVTVRENEETSVTITFDLSHINRPQQKEDR